MHGQEAESGELILGEALLKQGLVAIRSQKSGAIAQLKFPIVNETGKYK